MNSWNFNELTEQDILDYKSCQRQDQTIYGIPDKSECSTGKEISQADKEKLAIAANKGDKKAAAKLNEIAKVEKDQKMKARKEKAAADAEKKKKEAEAKGKKGKGGKGKKGGGKGKKGGGKGKAAKGGKGGKDPKGKAPAAKAKAADDPKAKAERRKQAISRARETVSKLQKMMRSVQDPKARQMIQEQISELVKSVVDATKSDTGKDQAQLPSSPNVENAKNKVAAASKDDGEK